METKIGLYRRLHVYTKIFIKFFRNFLNNRLYSFRCVAWIFDLWSQIFDLKFLHRSTASTRTISYYLFDLSHLMF